MLIYITNNRYYKVNIIKQFEKFSDMENNDIKSPIERKEKVERKEKKLKMCIGKCARSFFIKDDKPVIYCKSCKREF